MKSEATITLRVDDPELLKAALIDDPEAMDITIEDGALVLRAQSSTLLGLLRTLDDVLDCIRVSEA